MKNGKEFSEDLELDMCGIQRSVSQTKLGKVNHFQNLKNEFMDKTYFTKKEDMQTSISFNDLNVLGLKDYYQGEGDKNIEIKHQHSEENQTKNDNENEQFNATLDQLGQKLNEVIGHYLTELASQSRLSLDSFSLQNSENLDEEQQQQIHEFEINATRQKIYKQIVEKINLSVIQSVHSLQSSSSQSNIIQSNIFSKDYSNAIQNSYQIKTPQKSSTLSYLETLHQSPSIRLSKAQEQIIKSQDFDQVKDDTVQQNNKIKSTLTNFSQQPSDNSIIRKDDDIEQLIKENTQLKVQNEKFQQFFENQLCEKCKELLNNH